MKRQKKREQNYIAEEQPSFTTSTNGIMYTVFSFLLQVHEGKKAKWKKKREKKTSSARILSGETEGDSDNAKRQRHTPSISRKEFFFFIRFARKYGEPRAPHETLNPIYIQMPYIFCNYTFDCSASALSYDVSVCVCVLLVAGVGVVYKSIRFWMCDVSTAKRQCV